MMVVVMVVMVVVVVDSKVADPTVKFLVSVVVTIADFAESVEQNWAC